MKAVIVPKYGNPNVLEVVSRPKPVLTKDELLIRNHAAPITAADMQLRAGEPKMSRLFLGLNRPKQSIPGACFAGEVVAFGEDVASFNIGDRVFGLTGLMFGTYAEYLVVKANGVVVGMPDDLSYEKAAAFCDGHATSYNFLTQVVKLQRGQRILINGASGALGTAAIQIAKYFGANVTGVCSERNIGLVKSLGADEVLDYTKVDITSLEERYDIVYDTVGKLNYRKVRNILTTKGEYLSPVLEFKLLFHVLSSSLFTKKKARFEATGMNSPAKLKALLEGVLEIYDSGKLKTYLDRQYTMENIIDAHKYVEKGHKRGNVVMKLVN